jgi:hypothetical protein
VEQICALAQDSRRPKVFDSVAAWWALGASDATVVSDTTFTYSAWLRGRRRYLMDTQLDVMPITPEWRRAWQKQVQMRDGTKAKGSAGSKGTVGAALPPSGAVRNETMHAFDRVCRHIIRSESKQESDRWR